MVNVFVMVFSFVFFDSLWIFKRFSSTGSVRASGASGGSGANFVMLFGFLGGTLVSTAMLIWRVFTFYFGLLISLITVAVAKETKGGIMKAASGKNCDSDKDAANISPEAVSEE